MFDESRQRRPLVGVTADIEWRSDVQPPRLHHELDAHLSRSLYEAGATVVIVPHDDDDVDAWCERLDGVVVSGGAWVFPRPELIDETPATADAGNPRHKLRRARFEIALVRAALARDLPLLGICGGFQVLNRAVGGELAVDLAALDPAWSVHAGPDRSRTVHPVTAEPGTSFAALVGTQPFAVNSQHRQGVLETRVPARVAARADDGVVEAIEVPGKRFCLGVQWHPEFLLCAQDAALLTHFVDACRGSMRRPSARMARPARGGTPHP